MCNEDKVGGNNGNDAIEKVKKTKGPITRPPIKVAACLPMLLSRAEPNLGHYHPPVFVFECKVRGCHKGEVTRKRRAGANAANRMTSLVLLGCFGSSLFPVLKPTDVTVAIKEASIFLPSIGGRMLHIAVCAIFGGTPVGCGCLAIGLAVSCGRAAQRACGALESLGEVGVLVEVPEEEPEHDGMEADPPHESPRVVAVWPEK